MFTTTRVFELSLAPRLCVAASGTFGTSQKVVMPSLCKRLGLTLVNPAVSPGWRPTAAA